METPLSTSGLRPETQALILQARREGRPLSKDLRADIVRQMCERGLQTLRIPPRPSRLSINADKIVADFLKSDFGKNKLSGLARK